MIGALIDLSMAVLESTSPPIGPPPMRKPCMLIISFGAASLRSVRRASKDSPPAATMLMGTTQQSLRNESIKARTTSLLS